MLDLQRLKNRKGKHRKIYEKAHRIMKQGWKTPDLSEKEILDIANKYPTLNVKVLINNDIVVRSIKDSWLIIDEGRFYTLYHKGIVFEGRKAKESYHLQDVFYDLNYIFASIVSHDEYKMGIKQKMENKTL